MKIKLNSKIAIVVFVIVLIIPNATYPFLKQFCDQTNYENRELAQRPKFDRSNVLQFTTLYEDYYNDHLSYKNEFNSINSLVNLKLFKEVKSDLTILGKKGWLFYKGENGMAIEEYLAANLYNEEQLKQIQKNVEAYADAVKKDIGAEFVFMLIPDKEYVYQELLPDNIKAVSSTKRVDQIYNYLKEHSNVKVCYPYQQLIDAKKEDQVFYKYDTHWNSVGGYIGTRELLKTMGMPCKDSFTIEDGDHIGGGLANAITLGNFLNDDIDYKIVSSNKDTLKETYTEDRDNASMTKYKSTVKNGKRLYFIGDSFRDALKPHLALFFESSTFTHRCNVVKEDIKKENPDYVIYEMVERYNPELLNLNY